MTRSVGTRPRECRHQASAHWSVERIFKRVLDLAVGGIALLLLAPFLGVIGAAIKLTSSGPIFYRGVRVGRGGRRFRIFKFRTMVENADQLGGTTTGANDPRVTDLGRFLRDHKFDELPQLLNVILGQMSLVGPRPEVPEYADAYVGEEKLILSVKPGITDLSSLQFIDLQAHVGASDPDRVFRAKVLPEKNRLRLEYVRTWTFWGDLVILFKTGWRILSRAFRRPM